MPKQTRRKAVAIAPLPVLFVSAALISTMLSVGSDLQAFSVFSPSTWWGSRNAPLQAPPESVNIQNNTDVASGGQPTQEEAADGPPEDFQSTALMSCALPGQSCTEKPCCGTMVCNDGSCGPVEAQYPCTCTMRTCNEDQRCIGTCDENACDDVCAAPKKWLCDVPDDQAGPSSDTCQRGFYCNNDYNGTQFPTHCPVNQLAYKNDDCSLASCSNEEDEEPNPGADEDDPHCFECSQCAAEQIARHEEDPSIQLPKEINEGSFAYHPEFDETKPCEEQGDLSANAALLGQILTNFPNPCPGQPGARCRTNADCAQQPHPQECFPPDRPANEWGRCRRIGFKLVVFPNQVPLCSNDAKYDSAPWSNFVQGTYHANAGATDPYSSARQNCINASAREVACCRKNVNVPFAAGIHRGSCNTIFYVTAPGRPSPAIFNGVQLNDDNTGFGTNPCADVRNGNGIMYETGAPPANGIQCSATNDGTDANATCGGAYRAVYKQALGQPVCTNDPFWVPCRRRMADANGTEVCLPGVIAPPYLPRIADNQSPTGGKREAGRLALSASFQQLNHCQAAISGTDNCAKPGEACSQKVCCKPSGFQTNPLRCKNNVCLVNVAQDGQGGCLPGGSRCGGAQSCCRSLSCSQNECCLPPASAGGGLNRQSLIPALALFGAQGGNLTPPEIPLGEGPQGECWRRLTGTRQLEFIGEYGTWVYNTANTLYGQYCRWPWSLTQRCRVFFSTFQAELLRIKAIYEKLMGRR